CARDAYGGGFDYW
nr:immunoglobulin heavy chain junction region [Macaca mulatta]MOV53698.1 immunoglobulin heavy chain junction region [Macaca mulatta]MOV54044.1 immunoglobulin heavy chain junction region [Macaca mulatta]MOV54284.1 immunoglobulin heavy chain junction region [Macaca mulatta]MOV55038.1 immunoglobulin heavy chain junction region [Macaca mulatta]